MYDEENGKVRLPLKLSLSMKALVYRALDMLGLGDVIYMV